MWRSSRRRYLRRSKWLSRGPIGRAAARSNGCDMWARLRAHRRWGIPCLPAGPLPRVLRAIRPAATDMAKALAEVVITDARGRQVFGLSSAIAAVYTQRPELLQFGEYTVTLTVQDLPPWWVDAPGYLLYARIRNRVRMHYANIRTRHSVRRVLAKRRNPFYAETTSPSKSIPEDG